MKRIGFFSLLVFSFSTGLVAQISAPLQESVVKGGWGTVQNGKFISEKLGLTLSVPPEYNLISSVDAQILANPGVDMLKQGTASDTKIDEAVGRSILIVAIAEKPIGSPSEFGSRISHDEAEERRYSGNEPCGKHHGAERNPLQTSAVSWLDQARSQYFRRG